MEVMLLPYSNRYEKEVPHFIEECKKMAAKRGQLIQELQFDHIKQLEKVKDTIDLVMIPISVTEFKGTQKLDASDFQEELAETILKAFRKVNSKFTLGKSDYFHYNKPYGTETWWNRVKQESGKNFDIMKHYT